MHLKVTPGLPAILLGSLLALGAWDLGITSSKLWGADQATDLAAPAVKRGWTPKVWNNYISSDSSVMLPDFSRAGYAMGDRPIPNIQGPVFDVTSPQFGAHPDDGGDDTAAIQAAIDAAGHAGGGVVFLPRGRYEIRKTPGTPGLRITRDGVILRGAGNAASGTILHLGSPGTEGRVRRLGSIAADQEARSQAAIAIMGPEKKELLARYTDSLKRGNIDVRLSDSSLLHSGQIVVVSFEDPLIDVHHPAPEKADIPVQLTHPFRLTPDQTDTFGQAAKNLTWIVRIAEIVDAQHVRLAKPARFDQQLRYQPQIFTFDGITGVGIENLRIDSSWPGNYQHHKPYRNADGTTVIRTAQEQDYLWNGLWISNSVDGWVSGVTFSNLTQGVIVSHSADYTMKDIRFEGLDGHAGFTIGRSNDILISHADFHARLVHPITLTIMASGNVFSASTIHYDGRSDVTATDAAIDLHGLFPFENLFDNLRGFYVCPGGDMSVLPHGGVRNVFWNIIAPRQMSCYTSGTDNEFVRTYATAGTSSHSPATMFEHLPQAFYIGVQRQGGIPVTIGDSTVDRENDWLTVEGLNRPGITIESLYEAQRDNRRQLPP